MILFNDFSAAQQLSVAFDSASHMCVRPSRFDRRKRNHLELTYLYPAVVAVKTLRLLPSVLFALYRSFNTCGQQRSIFLHLDQVVGIFLDYNFLHDVPASVQRIEGHDRSADICQPIDQFVSCGDFLTFAMGQFLEKRGAEPL